MTRIAVISDTHGKLRPEVAEALAGSTLILHAGDLGTVAVLEALEAIAPTRAVLGNVDGGALLDRLPHDDVVEIDGRRLYLLHDRDQLDLDPSVEGAGFDAVITGHTHRPHQEVRGGVLYLNPGSVGPRRFSLPVTMAWLTLGDTPDDPLQVEFQNFDG